MTDPQSPADASGGSSAGPGGEGFLEPFLAVAAADPGRIFARFDGAPLSFGALEAGSAALAQALLARGHRPGDRAAVMLRNSVDALVVILALARAGLVWVPLNARQQGAGLAYLLGHSRPALIVAEADLAPALRDCGADLAEVDMILRGSAADDALAPLLVPGPHRPADPPPTPAPGAVLAIMYTSGTTGPPKGVPVTHRMLRLAAEGVRLVADARPGDVCFLWEPLYHIGGAQMIALPAMARVELAMTGGFSASRFWTQVRDSGATHIHYLGGILQILLKQPPDPAERPPRLRVAWGGGCPAEVFSAVQTRFGLAPRECYGMTEMSSITTAGDGSEGGTAGRALPWFTVTIRDVAGRPLPPGARGEITATTTDPGAFFAGYLDNPEATARALRDGDDGAGRVLHTGDIGSLDGRGVLRFHGRMSDSLRVRGENVSAWEVEHVATSHPDVEDCAAIGVPAEVGEQDILLHVCSRDGAAIDPADLWDWLSARLAPYQTPRYIAFVQGFERTPSQRILKHRLPQTPATAWDRQGAGGG